MPSQFPNAYDTFRTFSDPQASDMTNVNRYRELRAKSSLTPTEEVELNSLLTTLRDKLILAEDVNLLTDSMGNMQVFTKESIQNYYKYRGDWSATPDPVYSIFNTVRYTDGQIYLAVQTPGSAAPTDATVWQLIGKKGDQGVQGPAGANLVPKGAYDPAISYIQYDLVTYNGKTYYAIQATTGNLPTDTTYWEPFVSGFSENLNDLQTTDKSSFVGAVNEISATTNVNSTSIGDMQTLNVDATTNLVDAVNTTHDKVLSVQANLSNIQKIATYQFTSNISGGTGEEGEWIFVLPSGITAIHSARLVVYGKKAVDITSGAASGGSGWTGNKSPGTSTDGSHSHNNNSSFSSTGSAGDPSHSHTYASFGSTNTSGSHSHTVSSHDHSIGSHTHSATKALSQSTTPTGVNVYLDNGAGYGSSLASANDPVLIDVDIALSLTMGTGIKKLKVTTTRLGRVDILLIVTVS